MADGAATEVNPVPIPETADIQVVGPYRGPRISGASNAVDEMSFSRSYMFDGYGVCINDIPAKRDNSTGRLYISAAVAKRVHAKVREIEAAMERIRADIQGMLPPIRPMFFVSASEFFSDAA